jgi:hypothetical protein
VVGLQRHAIGRPALSTVLELTMRWKRKDRPCRVKTRFLFFPKRIGSEWRWLEIASWVEVFNDTGGFYDPREWTEKRWH